jgi:hypothetical protein
MQTALKIFDDGIVRNLLCFKDFDALVACCEGLLPPECLVAS